MGMGNNIGKESGMTSSEFYLFIICFSDVILRAVAQHNSGPDFNKTTSTNINSSIVDTLRDFLDNFLQEYERNPGERRENVCQPSPCHKSEECVRIGEEGYRCICPPGMEQIMEEEEEEGTSVCKEKELTASEEHKVRV